jgi:hypothetical protein
MGPSNMEIVDSDVRSTRCENISKQVALNCKKDWDVVAEAQIPSSTPLGRAVALMPPGEIDYLNFKDVFCDSAVSHTVIGGIPAYMDDNHISAPLARSLAARIEKLIIRKDPGDQHRGSILPLQASPQPPNR